MRALTDVPVKEIRRKLSRDGDHMVRRIAVGSMVLVLIVAVLRYAIDGAASINFQYSLVSFGLLCAVFIASARRMAPAQVTGALLMTIWIMQVAVIELLGNSVVGPMTVVAPLLAVVATLVIGKTAGWVAVATLMVMELVVVLARPHLSDTAGGERASAFVATLLDFSVMFVTAFAAWIGWYYSKLNKEMLELILRQATQDYLTHVPNRRTVDETFARALRSCGESEHWMSFMLIDVDYFKRFNDTFGHQAGDEALIRVAAVVRDVAEANQSTPGRYGGEEFAVVMPDANPERATAVAEDIRQKTMELSIASASPTGGPLTVSIGICSVNAPLATALENVALAADQALYDSKSAGRNQVQSRVIEENVKRLPRFPASRNRPGAQVS